MSRKRIQWLMRAMGLRAIYRLPVTSWRAPEHPVYPYLLRHVRSTRLNQVWGFGHHLPAHGPGGLYLVAVLAWRMSNMLEACFCDEALEEALGQGQSDVFHTDLGSQFAHILQK